MKIDIRWSNKQIDILNSIGIHPSEIQSYCNESNIFIKTRSMPKFNNDMKRLIGIATCKPEDEFKLTTGIKIAKLKFLKSCLHLLRKNIKELMLRIQKDYRLDMKWSINRLSEINSILSSYQ